MPEIGFAQDTLEYVKLFMRMGVTDSWLYRMLIGRMYYAAHHLGRRLLMEAGLQPDEWRGNVHQRVREELRVHYVVTQQMTPEALEALNRLLHFRRRADYELGEPVRLRDVNHAAALMDTFVVQCYRILEVS